MSRLWFARAFAIVLLVAWAVPVGAQSFAWWKSEQFQREVGLTTDQCARIEAVFQSMLPKLRERKEELDKQEAELSTLIENNADEALVVKQIDRMEATRAALFKTRTLMLLHMHQVLKPDQIVKFRAAFDKWNKDHRNRG